MKLTIKNVRIAFPSLFKAQQVQGQGEPRFSVALLIPRDHPQVDEINKALAQSAKDKWAAKADAVVKQLKAQDRLALHDGDLKENYDGFPGNYFISASSKTRPLVINRDKSPIAEEDGIVYAGCYANVSIELWAQDNQFGKRINASLRGVQFYKDGDAFTGGGAASVDEFADLSADTDDSDLV